jgi:hypothetical protein
MGSGASRQAAAYAADETEKEKTESVVSAVAASVALSVATMKVEVLQAIKASAAAANNDSEEESEAIAAASAERFEAPARGIDRYGALDLTASPADERKSSITATLGSQVYDHRGLTEVLDAGVNVARINMSHASTDWATKIVDLIVEYRHQNPGRVCGLCVELKGPLEARLGYLGQNKESILRPNHEILFSVDQKYRMNSSTETMFVDLPEGGPQSLSERVSLGSLIVIKAAAPSTSFIKLVVMECGSLDGQSIGNGDVKCGIFHMISYAIIRLSHVDAFHGRCIACM